MRLMRAVRNTFWDGYAESGTFSVRAGRVNLVGDFPDRCHIFVNGCGEDGVYLLEREGGGLYIRGISDCLFTGTIYRLRVPPDFLALVCDAEAYAKKAGSGDLVSERFGDYSYTRKGGGSLESVFAARLRAFKKMSDPVLDEVR